MTDGLHIVRKCSHVVNIFLCSKTLKTLVRCKAGYSVVQYHDTRNGRDDEIVASGNLPHCYHLLLEWLGMKRSSSCCYFHIVTAYQERNNQHPNQIGQQQSKDFTIKQWAGVCIDPSFFLPHYWSTGLQKYSAVISHPRRMGFDAREIEYI